MSFPIMLTEKYLDVLEERRRGCTTGNPDRLPPLNQTTFSTVWIPAMKGDFQECKIPDTCEAEAGILYLPDGIRQRMIKKRDQDWEESGIKWMWDDFVREVEADLRCRAVVTGVAAGVILGPAIIVAGLGILGFGAAGLAAGSAAAAIQSVVYGGATTGLFSVCQAIGATGSVGAAGTAISGLIGGLSGIAASRRR